MLKDQEARLNEDISRAKQTAAEVLLSLAATTTSIDDTACVLRSDAAHVIGRSSRPTQNASKAAHVLTMRGGTGGMSSNGALSTSTPQVRIRPTYVNPTLTCSSQGAQRAKGRVTGGAARRPGTDTPGKARAASGNVNDAQAASKSAQAASQSIQTVPKSVQAASGTGNGQVASNIAQAAPQSAQAASHNVHAVIGSVQAARVAACRPGTDLSDHAAPSSAQAVQNNVQAVSLIVQAASDNIQAVPSIVQAASESAQAALIGAQAGSHNVYAVPKDVQAMPNHAHAESDTAQAASGNVQATREHVQGVQTYLQTAPSSFQAASHNVQAAVDSIQAHVSLGQRKGAELPSPFNEMALPLRKGTEGLVHSSSECSSCIADVSSDKGHYQNMACTCSPQWQQPSNLHATMVQPPSCGMMRLSPESPLLALLQHDSPKL